MSNAIKRTIRTFFQTFLGTVIASGILSATETTGVVDWSSLKKVGISAISAGLVSVITFIQNWLEDSDKIPTVFK